MAMIGKPRACSVCGGVKYYLDKHFAKIAQPYTCRRCQTKARSQEMVEKSLKATGYKRKEDKDG